MHVRPSYAQREREAVEDKVAQLEAERDARFAAANLDLLAVRRELAPLHPMLEQRYFIETEEANKFYLVVYDHGLARKSGLYAYGEFRVGKTTLVEEAERRLAKDMPWLAVLYYSAEREANRSSSSMYKDMLAWFKYPVSKRQDPEEVLVRFIMATAASKGSRTCLLFIDEAHMLTVQQLRYLLDVWNRLKRHRFVLVTILVGQTGSSGLESLRQLTQEEDHGAVIARFLVMPYFIGGLHDQGQLKAYLGAFDSELVYPLGTQWSYSRFFCRRAFDAGWRLEREAPLLWRALLDHSGAESSKLEHAGFRLAFVNDSIHAFLLDAMGHDRSGFKGTPQRWNEAVFCTARADLFI